MRAAEWGVSKKKSTEDDDFLKPQWLPRPGAAGISNQFRSAGGRKGGFDDRRTRRPDGLAFKPGSSLSPSEDFPPLAPFYRSHSTGSLTPADIPSASSRLLSASKEEKHFSINRECDFPTLAPATVVDQPARMHKSKSATALPQAISPSSDLLKAHHTTLSALAGAPVSPVAPVASPNVSAAVGTTPAPTEALAGGPAKQPQHSHQKKPSFSDKVSFSEIAASEKAVAANNRAKFERAAAANQRELQRLKSLVPSKPVHPSLSRTNGRAVRPKMPPVTTNVLKTAPSPSRESFAALPASPATLRKATSAPVLPMASNDHLLSRSPPSHPPSLLVPVVPDASTSGHAASSGPSSPPRPALMPSSRSARTLPQATTPFTSSSSPPRPALMPSSRSARTLPQATVGMAPPGLVKHHTSFALPLASASRLPSVKQTGDSAGADSSTPSSSSSASSSSSFTGAPVASPRRRDSSPPAATSSAISSTRTSPLSSPRRSSSPATGGVPHHNSDPSLLSAPLSPRMPSAATVNGGSNSASSSSSSSSSFSSSSPSSSSSSSSSAPPLTSSATASNGGKTAGKKTKPLRNSGSSSSSSAVSKQSASNGGKQQQQQQSRKKKQQQQQQQQPNGRRRSSLPPDDDTSVESTGVARHATSGHRGTGLSNNNSNSCGGMTSEILAHPWLPRPTQTYTVFARHYPLQQPYHHHHHRSGGGSSGSEGSGSEDDLAFETAEYDRVNDEELMLIATGATTCIAVPLIDINEEAQEEQEEAAASAAAWGGDSAGPLTEDLCPFSWEARADGKWNEWSEESVRTFMKEKLDYEVEVVGGQEDDEGQGLTDEEIRLAKQQISAGLQQMLEKKKRNLSESLKKAVAADLRLSTSTSPAQLHHHPRPAGTTPAATTTTAAATATAADAAPVQSTSRRGHKQPLRSNSGPAAASLRGGQRRHHLSPEHGHDVVLDSDSDESEGEEVHSFHGIVFG